MRGICAGWLAAGILAFGVGFAGALLTGSPRGGERLPASPTERPRLSGITPSLPPRGIAHPELQVRINFLQSLTQTEIRDLPDLVRGVIEDQDGRWDVEKMIPIIDRWIELDPVGGFEFFATEFDDPGRLGLPLFTQRWAVVDADAAIRAIEELGDDKRLSTAIFSIGSELAKRRPTDFFRLHDHGFGDYYVAEAARNLASEDPQAMLAALGRFDESVRSGMQADLALSWAQRDPQAATEWASGLDDGVAKSRVYRALAAGVILTDPGGAAELFALGQEADQRPEFEGYSGEDFTLDQVARRLAREDPQAAFQWAVEAGKNPTSAIGKFVPSTADGMIDYIAGLPEETFHGDGSTAAVQQVFAWSPTDLEAGLSRLGEITSQPARELAHRWLLEQQAISDPGKAITAATQEITSPPNRAAILEPAFRAWAASDPAAASEALAQQAPGSDRDAGIRGLIEITRHAEPDAALEWAASISDPGLREMETQRILFKEPIAWALSTLDSLDLGEADIESIRQSLRLEETP